MSWGGRSLVVFQVVFLRDRFDGRDVFRRRVVVSETHGQLLVEVLDEVLHRLEAADLPGETVVQVREIVQARRRFPRITVQPVVRRRGRLELVEILPVLVEVG